MKIIDSIVSKAGSFAADLVEKVGTTAAPATKGVTSGVSTAKDAITGAVSAAQKLDPIGAAFGKLGFSRTPSIFRTLLGGGGMFVVGAAVGATAGVLLAPAAGSDTRKQLIDKLRSFRGPTPQTAEVKSKESESPSDEESDSADNRKVSQRSRSQNGHGKHA